MITYLFVGLFLILIGYFAYFQIYKSEDFINSPYNTRQETFAEHVVPGEYPLSGRQGTGADARWRGWE